MSFKNWVNQEKKDLKNGFYSYPKRKILFLVLGVFLLLGAIFRLWLVISFETVSLWDNLAVHQIKQFRTPFLDRFFSFLTIFGSGYFIIGAFLILAIFLARQRRRKAAVAVFLTLVGSGLLLYLFKDFFSRPRPFGCLSSKDCFSFPSGHATIAFYFYGMLFYLIVRFIKLKKIAVWLLGLGLTILIFLVALSRIYLGYHFPTDIIGGFLLGGVFLLVVAILVDFFYQQ